MEISQKFTSDDWKNLNLSIKSSPNDWTKAIEVLKDRITKRYIEPVNLLISHEKDNMCTERKFGFTIVAIVCLLIETLQAFKTGDKETIHMEEAFVKFLTESKFLKEYFSEELSKRFYKEYRNGILHQAQTKNGALIWSIGQKTIWIDTDNIMIINRTKLFSLLKQDFEYYLKQLASIDEKRLRKNFIKKMDFISKI